MKNGQNWQDDAKLVSIVLAKMFLRCFFFTNNTVIIMVTMSKCGHIKQNVLTEVLGLQYVL